MVNSKIVKKVLDAIESIEYSIKKSIVDESTKAVANEFFGLINDTKVEQMTERSGVITYKGWGIIFVDEDQSDEELSKLIRTAIYSMYAAKHTGN